MNVFKKSGNSPIHDVQVGRSTNKIVSTYRFSTVEIIIMDN